MVSEHKWFGQQPPTLSRLFEKAYSLGMKLPPAEALHTVPVMTAEIIPKGIVLLIDPEIPETKKFYEVFRAGAEKIKEVTQRLAEVPETSAEALWYESVKTNIVRTADSANELIRTGEVKKIKLPFQFENPYIQTWYCYPPSWVPQEPVERVETTVIPPFGHVATTLKESKGIKLELQKAPIKPPLWPGIMPWPPTPVFHLRLVPVEFVKIISLRNICGRITKRVEKQIIREEELRDFWKFFKKDP